MAQKITGFEVYRSLDNKVWAKVATNQFAAPTSASSLSWSDNDPTFQAGTTYFYKIRCFDGNTTNNGGYSQYSVAMASTFLPAFQANLVSPATETVSSTLTPRLSFSLSNPALFDPTLSDYMYFYLSLTEKTGTAGSYTKSYRYNFALARFESRTSTSSSTWTAASDVTADAAHTTITIQSPAGYFQPGVSDQWTVFGTTGATPCQFRKFTYPLKDSTSTSYGVALSYGSTYEHSYGAVNGTFTLTIDPSAQ